jgi:hypothetical protein
LRDEVVEFVAAQVRVKRLIWIAVRLVGGYERADDLDGGAVSASWSTVVTRTSWAGCSRSCSCAPRPRTTMRTTWSRYVVGTPQIRAVGFVRLGALFTTVHRLAKVDLV